MKSRHISGINDKIELLSQELTELGQTLLSEQKKNMNQTASEMQDELENGKIEAEKVHSLKDYMETNSWTDKEFELLNSHFNTQKRFALYLADYTLKRANIEYQIHELATNVNIDKMKSLKHKKEHLDDGIIKYYHASGDERDRLLDILYEMIDNIYEPTFYDYALKLNLK